MGWSSGPGTQHPTPANRWIIVFNGNAGSRVERTELGSQLEAQGFGVILVDYRGYGGNPGSPSEAGLALDARAANQWAREPEPKELVIVRGADHNDPELVAGPDVIEAIDRFVDQATDGQR